MNQEILRRESPESAAILPFLGITAIAAYAMMFEWRGIFELDFLSSTAASLKIIIPILFLLFMLQRKQSSSTSASGKKYLVFFVLFMVWGLFSCLFSSPRNETLIQWLKYLPRLMFCYSICLYVQDDENIRRNLIKCFIAIAAFTVLQYITMEIALSAHWAQCFDMPIPRGGIYCGPGGMLGQAAGQVYFGSNFGLPLHRLYGLWLEPSSAAGFLLAAYFLSEALHVETKSTKSRIVGFACLAGGVATFSTAAYCAIGVSGLAGEAFFLKADKNRWMLHLVKAFFFSALIIYSLFGRLIVAKYFSSHMNLRYVTGVRDSTTSPYGGRMDLAKSNLESFAEGPTPAKAAPPSAGMANRRRIARLTMGIGFQIPGKDAQGRGFPISASAILYWFIFTGGVGLSLLLLREIQVAWAVRERIASSLSLLRFFQAWLVLFIQNLSYGTWMNPFYFVTVALVFSAVHDPEARGASCRDN